MQAHGELRGIKGEIGEYWIIKENKGKKNVYMKEKRYNKDF